MTKAPDERVYARFDDVPWATWHPHECATLLFVIRAGQMLLIHKKRGLGAGKINGPGGRLALGELPLHGAVREVQEELCITPTGMRQCGELAFQFTDGLALLVYVFTAAGCDGEPQETEEAIPLWTPLGQIPYDSMWADDRHWFPPMLAGQQFQGQMLFNGDLLLGQHMTINP
jgi:8-oxo-dGTP diphosphatase